MLQLCVGAVQCHAYIITSQYTSSFQDIVFNTVHVGWVLAAWFVNEAKLVALFVDCWL